MSYLTFVSSHMPLSDGVNYGTWKDEQRARVNCEDLHLRPVTSRNSRVCVCEVQEAPERFCGFVQSAPPSSARTGGFQRELPHARDGALRGEGPNALGARPCASGFRMRWSAPRSSSPSSIEGIK